MEINKMKKCLSIIILSFFVLSMIGSVTPEVKSYVKVWTGDQKYASTQLPSPPSIQASQNLAGK
jgi:hypothetical protein